tara:strand:- start:195 stop:788 length:594 start_codon:yes stop_codon:yes gene_type:complete
MNIFKIFISLSYLTSLTTALVFDVISGTCPGTSVLDEDQCGNAADTLSNKDGESLKSEYIISSWERPEGCFVSSQSGWTFFNAYIVDPDDEHIRVQVSCSTSNKCICNDPTNAKCSTIDTTSCTYNGKINDNALETDCAGLVCNDADADTCCETGLSQDHIATLRIIADAYDDNTKTDVQKRACYKAEFDALGGCTN